MIVKEPSPETNNLNLERKVPIIELKNSLLEVSLKLLLKVRIERFKGILTLEFRAI